MGEVYRARDTRLGRDVAVKISNEKFTDRFEREARSIAALNHPNICQLYDVGNNYLVMELIEGETPKGPLPVEIALNYARQIADALEAAHEKGIVHRDLKPANILITPPGTVKVLDFGLAKAGGTAAAQTENSPTLTMGTQAGMILGTAAYMSPEQARGKLVDRRSDIWAFGAVLYELLTGDPAFRGETVTDILAAVVKSEPDWTAVPEKVRPLLRKCLEKDPRSRLRDIGDFELLLGHAAESPAKSSLPWMFAGLAAIASIVLAFGWWHGRSATDRPLAPLFRLDVDLGHDVSLGLRSPILSPDGTAMVYVSAGRLFFRRLGENRAFEVPGWQGTRRVPFFSPDGQWIGFNQGGGFKKMHVDGSSLVSVSDAGGSSSGFGGASWGNDEIVASLAPTAPLVRIPGGGGAATPLTTLDTAHGEVSHRWPQVVAGGTVVVFTANRSAGMWDQATIEVLSLRDHRRKTVYRGASFGRYVPSGHLLFVRRGTVFAVPFDLDRLETRGTPLPVIEQVYYTPSTGFAAVDFSSAPGAGVAVYHPPTAGEAVLDWLEPSGLRELRASPGDYNYPRISPDGQRVALIMNADLYVYEPRRETMTRLTFTGDATNNPVWTPDGRFIVYTTSVGMEWTRSDGGGKPAELVPPGMPRFPTSFSPDGRRLAYTVSVSGSFDLLTLPIESDGAGLRAGPPEVFLNSRFSERDAAFSPDGHWMAYFSNESGANEVYVRSFPGRGAKWQISNAGGSLPVWSGTTKEIFFRNSEDRLMSASYTIKGDAFVANKPRLWSNTMLTYGIPGARHYDLAPDGRRFVAVLPKAGEGLDNHVTFLMNFFDELRRRVPSGK